MSRRSNRSDTRRVRSRSAAFRSSGYRLMVESLEVRGMLSATVGSLADVAVDDLAVEAPAVSLPQVEESFALPGGVSLLVCPTIDWSAGAAFQLAPTAADDSAVSVDEFGMSTGVLESTGVLGCIGYPPATFFLSGETENELTDPQPVELAPEDSADPIVDPVIITDPVVTIEPGGIDDPYLVPPTVEPIDIRVQFVSSDPGWAAYYYSVAADGSVYVMVRASYDEPTISAFVSGDSESLAYATVEDTGDGWFIWNFPADLAPPVPETGVFAPPTGGVDPIFETVGNSDPTLDTYLEFVRQNPTWPEENGASGIQLQVITASTHLPWIEFGTPGEAKAFDTWYEQTWPIVTQRNEDGIDTTAGGETDLILYACDGYPLPREFCVLPPPFDFTAVDEVMTSDSELPSDVRAVSTVGGTQSPIEVPSTNDISYSWMAAFAANLPGAGGDSTQPVTGRRRSR